MYCEKCGAQLTEGSKFCDNCGMPVMLPESRAEDPGQFPGGEEGLIEGQKISENIYLCTDGKYRWVYEFDMIRNPTILILVWKVLGMAFIAVMLLMMIMSLASGDGIAIPEWDDCKYAVMCFAILFGPVSILSYIIVAASYGWRYVVVFAMDEEGVENRQLKSQVKKGQAMGWITVLAGIASGRISTIGAGMLAATRNSMYSEFSKVKEVVAKLNYNVIKVNEMLGKNQVYADNMDFDFVLNYIQEHTPNAKHK